MNEGESSRETTFLVFYSYVFLVNLIKGFLEFDIIFSHDVDQLSLCILPNESGRRMTAERGSTGETRKDY